MNSGNGDLINRSQAEELTARMPRQDLKSLFYLFAGKPDSRIKTFDRAIEVNHSDIIELNDMVVDKLETHDVEAVVTSVKVGYEASQMSEFGTWNEFESHKFTDPEKVEEVIVKWDFLVKIRNYLAPQRHTLMFRVAREPKPSQLLHMLGAGNHDELDQVDMLSCPAFCRVDFINAQLSKELINVVDSWYQGRPQPSLIQPFLFWLKQKRNLVAVTLDQWSLLSWALLVASIGYFLGVSKYSGSPSLLVVAVALFLAIYSFRPVGRLSGMLVNRVYKAISEVEGSKVVFNLTSGDRRKITEQKHDNKKQGRRFLFASAWNIALNIVATLIYIYFFHASSG